MSHKTIKAEVRLCQECYGHGKSYIFWDSFSSENGVETDCPYCEGTGWIKVKGVDKDKSNFVQ